MNQEEALAHAKRMYQKLAQLSMHSEEYRERAAVLVDVLAYAGYESEAENLALALAGRRPRGEPATPGYEAETLAQEVGNSQEFVLGPSYVPGWAKRIRAPASSFVSTGGRFFRIANGIRENGRWGPESVWAISFRGRLAGRLARDSKYKKPLYWHGSLSPLRWDGPVPSPGGYDVAAFRTVKQCLKAWGQSADEILDYREGRLSQ